MIFRLEGGLSRDFLGFAIFFDDDGMGEIDKYTHT